MEQPTLETDRLTLRAFTDADAPEVQRMAGRFEIADVTENIPHPYPDGAAESWISTHGPGFDDGRLLVLAIERSEDRALLGSIGLDLHLVHGNAELGYWIGIEHWGRGYATEAARAVIRHGFEELNLHRIFARYFARNVASGRVLEKAGMVPEGTYREHRRHGSRFEDVELRGILVTDP